MGTSPTVQQIQQMEKLTKELVFYYNGDNIGFKATNRGIELFRQNSRLGLSVVVTPGKLDPGEYLRRYGEASFQRLVAHGRETAFTLKSCYLKQGKNLENEKNKIEYPEEPLAELSRVVSPIERDMYLSQLPTEFRISRETIRKQLRELRRTSQQDRRGPQENQYTQTKRQETV